MAQVWSEMSPSTRALKAVEDALHNAHHFPEELRKATALIADQLHRHLSVDEIAQVAGCSPSHLNRCFRRYFDQSTTAYLIEQRLARAADLLLGTQRSIDDICYACGFSQRAYFSRLFKRHLQQSPAAYRHNG
jgi:AraC-like DNA-binding protein